MDPEVVDQTFARNQQHKVLQTLTRREPEVLATMAEGCSNMAIAARLAITERAVEKHASNIFAKLGLPPSTIDGLWSGDRSRAYVRPMSPPDRRDCLLWIIGGVEPTGSRAFARAGRE